MAWYFFKGPRPTRVEEEFSKAPRGGPCRTQSRQPTPGGCLAAYWASLARRGCICVSPRHMAWLSRTFGKKKTEAAGFQHIDFITTFPFIDWVSEWGADESYPEGFRYKVVSVLREPETTTEFVLIRELRDGTKAELSRFTGAADRMSAVEEAIRRLGQQLSIRFQRFDMRAYRTFAAYKERAIELGWDHHEPQPKD